MGKIERQRERENSPFGLVEMRVRELDVDDGTKIKRERDNRGDRLKERE